MFLSKRALALAIALLVLAAAVAGCTREAPQPTAPTVEILEDPPGDGNLRTLRQTGQGPIGDPEADAAFDHATRVLSYFRERFGRDSFDGRATTLTVSVRDTDDNPFAAASAEWDRELGEIKFAEGWVTLEGTAHLFMHGVVQETADLGGASDEPGALNVALGDIFATGLDRDWTMGEDDPAGPSRNLAHPARLGDAAHMRDYHPGGHLGAMFANSTILSHAYFLLAQEVGRDTAEKIVWTALTRHLEPASGFEAFHSACVRAATERHGAHSAEVDAVKRAFGAVGLGT